MEWKEERVQRWTSGQFIIEDVGGVMRFKVSAVRPNGMVSVIGRYRTLDAAKGSTEGLRVK